VFSCWDKLSFTGEDQFCWFKSVGGLLCSTTVVWKQIVFMMNASDKDVLFNAKYSLVRLLTLGLFQNRLLDSAGSHIKEEGKLNMWKNSCLVAEN